MCGSNGHEFHRTDFFRFSIKFQLFVFSIYNIFRPFRSNKTLKIAEINALLRPAPFKSVYGGLQFSSANSQQNFEKVQLKCATIIQKFQKQNKKKKKKMEEKMKIS